MSKMQPKALWVAIVWAVVGAAVGVALHWPLHSAAAGIATLALPLVAGVTAYRLARNNRADAA